MPNADKTEFEIVLKEMQAEDARVAAKASHYGVSESEVRATEAAMDKQAALSGYNSERQNSKWGSRVSFLGQQGAEFMDPFSSAQAQAMDLERRMGGLTGSAIFGLAGLAAAGPGGSQVWAQVGREIAEAAINSIQREERFAVGRAQGDIESTIVPLARMGVPDAALKELAQAIAPFAGATAAREARARAIAANTHIETGLTMEDISAALQMKIEQLQATLQQRARFYGSAGEKK